jgi:hypothetical protein
MNFPFRRLHKLLKLMSILQSYYTLLYRLQLFYGISYFQAFQIICALSENHPSPHSLATSHFNNFDLIKAEGYCMYTGLKRNDFDVSAKLSYI